MAADFVLARGSHRSGGIRDQGIDILVRSAPGTHESGAAANEAVEFPPSRLQTILDLVRQSRKDSIRVHWVENAHSWQGSKLVSKPPREAIAIAGVQPPGVVGKNAQPLR